RNLALDQRGLDSSAHMAGQVTSVVSAYSRYRSSEAPSQSASRCASGLTAPSSLPMRGSSPGGSAGLGRMNITLTATPSVYTTYANVCSKLGRTAARMSAAEFTEASAKISEVEANIKQVEEKIEGQERSYPASVRPAEVTVELEQLRKQEIILLEELVELRKYKNILLTKGT
ncbi:hypothetical protein QJQ45_019394, partial [Haematococcus lacustris]